ncbi:hypothetical protein Tco_0816531, partial [Tanacetum coccineum]
PDVIQARGLWEAPGSVGFVHQSFSRTNGVQSQPLSQPFYVDYSTNVATPIQHAVNGQSVRRRLLSKDTKESAFVNIEGFSQPLVGKPVSERFQQQSLVSPLTAGNVSITEAHEGNSKCEVLSSVLFLSDVLIRAFISGCSYEATSSRKNRSLAKELVTGAVAYVFLQQSSSSRRNRSKRSALLNQIGTEPHDTSNSRNIRRRLLTDYVNIAGAKAETVEQCLSTEDGQTRFIQSR